MSHLLGFITVTKHGLKETELLDILSCDDEVLLSIVNDEIQPSITSKICFILSTLAIPQ